MYTFRFKKIEFTPKKNLSEFIVSNRFNLLYTRSIIKIKEIVIFFLNYTYINSVTF